MWLSQHREFGSVSIGNHNMHAHAGIAMYHSLAVEHATNEWYVYRYILARRLGVITRIAASHFAVGPPQATDCKQRTRKCQLDPNAPKCATTDMEVFVYMLTCTEDVSLAHALL